MKNFFLIFLLMFCTSIYAQDKSKIDIIKSYIEEVTKVSDFISETTQGEIDRSDGTKVSFSRSFYFLDEEELFSVFYQEYGVSNVRKIYYFKNNELIGVIIEFSSEDQKEQQLQYFFEQEQLINVNEEHPHYLASDILKEALEFRK